MSNIEDLGTCDKIARTLNSMAKLLQEKNRLYGDSALSGVKVFSKHIKEDLNSNGILIRLDDKLNRVLNADQLRKNDVSDIIGYLTLLCIAHGWDNFDDLID